MRATLVADAPINRKNKAHGAAAPPNQGLEIRSHQKVSDILAPHTSIVKFVKRSDEPQEGPKSTAGVGEVRGES